MGDFLDIAADLMWSGEAAEKRGDFEKVFAAIGGMQAVHSKAQLDLTNIESIFTALELGRVIQKVPGLQLDQVPAVIASLKELIVKTLEVRIPFPVKNQQINAPSPYEAFADLLRYLRADAFPTHSVSVITFNYDIAVDVAMYREGLGPDYVIERSPDRSDPVQLMKLHGSLNWASEKGTKTVKPLHLANYFHRYSVAFPTESARFALGAQLSEYFNRYEQREVELEPVIVPPSWNKADYHNAISNVWAAAARHLSEAQHIFVMGYSLPSTDAFFRHLYALGSVGDAPLRQFRVFDPETSDAVNDRFRALLGPAAASRYGYWRLTFGQAIAHVRNLFPPRRS